MSMALQHHYSTIKYYPAYLECGYMSILRTKLRCGALLTIQTRHVYPEMIRKREMGRTSPDSNIQ